MRWKRKRRGNSRCIRRGIRKMIRINRDGGGERERQGVE